MTDNTTLNSGTGGDTIRDVSKSGVKTPVAIIDIGGAGAESLLSASNPMPVSGTVTTSPSGTQTISGAVTANAGTNLNTSALALESGGNLATLAGAVSGGRGQANIAQVGGAAVPTPTAANIASAPTASRPNALYVTATQAVNTGGTLTTVTMPVLTEAGNTVYDADSCQVVVANPSGSAQNITSATLTFTDAIGGTATTLTYTIPLSGNVAAGASQSAYVPLYQGVLATPKVNVTFAAAPTAGTVTALCVFRKDGSAQGNLAAGQTDAGNPVGIGSVANSAVPSAVSAGQRVKAWMTPNGALVTTPGIGLAGAVDNTYSAQTSLSVTGTANVPAAAMMALNGGNLDRWRNNTDLTLLASAARAAATASPDQVNYNGRGVRVVLSVTAASGTGGLQVQMQGKDSISLNYYQINASPTAVTATGTYVYDLYPATLAAAANGITQVTQALLPRSWRVNVAAGDSSSYSYSVSAVTIL